MRLGKKGKEKERDKEGQRDRECVFKRGNKAGEKRDSKEREERTRK